MGENEAKKFALHWPVTLSQGQGHCKWYKKYTSMAGKKKNDQKVCV